MKIHIIIGTGYRPVVAMRRKNRDISTSTSTTTSIASRINHSHDFITTVINRSSSLAAPSQKMKTNTVLNLRFESVYRVMLHYSNWTRDDTKHIAEKVKFGVPILTMLECEKVVKNTFANGVSMVCVITEDKAVLYCEALLRVGLKATVEEA